MQQSIEDLLNALGQAFTSQLVAANDDAKAAQSELAQFKSSLSALVGASTPTNSQVAEAHPAPVQIVNPALAERKSRLNKSLADDALLAALGTDWMTAVQLRTTLLNGGYSVSEGTIYNRMRKLVLNHPEVATTPKPERWRLTPNWELEASASPKPVLKKQKKVRSNSTSGGLTQASNDNSNCLHQPFLRHGDCLDTMASIPDGSVDLILADLPYGVTGVHIDERVPMDRLWKEYRRVVKPSGNIVLFASQPFTTALVNAAPDLFKYSLVWEKTRGTGYLHCRDRPLKVHEDILIFSPGTVMRRERSSRRATFNPVGAEVVTKVLKAGQTLNYLNTKTPEKGREYEGLINCPRSVLKFPKDKAPRGKGHPFAKPVALLEHLIEAYSDSGELVLDNTMGSGSTCVAAMRTGRRSIGVEQDTKWFDVAVERVAKEARTLSPQPLVPTVTPLALPLLTSEKVEASQPQVSRLPTYQSEGVQLFEGDCLDVMKTMVGESVDLVFTSPPYNLGVSSGGGIKNSRKSGRWKNAALAEGYASYDDAREPSEYIEWQKDILRECWRLLRPDGAIFYQHKPRGQNKILQTPLDLNPGLPLRQIIIWNRNNGFNFNPSYFLSTHEWIMVLAKPDFRLTAAGKRMKDVWTIKPERNNPHPAPFPLELPLTAIEATSAKVVLDPFAGSGTTGVAARRCGRDFIGIELDPGYLAGAKERIESEALRLAA